MLSAYPLHQFQRQVAAKCTLGLARINPVSATMGMTAIILFCLADCGLGYDYAQCVNDSDCQNLPGKPPFCTADRLCVSDTPVPRLCTTLFPADPLPTAIPIGALFHVTKVPVPDTLQLNAMELAIRDVNRVLAPSGQQIVVHICDISQNPASQDTINHDVAEALRVLVGDRHVVAVLGPSRSDEILSRDVAMLARSAHVPLVSPTAGASTLSEQAQPSFLFRTYPSAGVEAPRLARMVTSPAQGGLALAFSDNLYGTDYQTNFLGEWTALGQPEPVVNRQFLSLDKDELRSVACEIKNSRMKVENVVLLSLAQDLPVLAEELKSLPTSIPIYMSPGGQSSQLLALIDTLQEDQLCRIHGISGYPDEAAEAATNTFRSAYSAEFNVDSSHNIYTTYTYDAAFAIAIAVASIQGTPTGELVERALKQITSKSAQAFSVGFRDYQAAFQMLQRGPISLRGASGTFGFSDTGDRNRSDFAEWNINLTEKTFRYTRLN